MTTAADQPVMIHRFEAAGLGKAPFRYSHVTDLGSGPSRGGSCDYCSAGIRYAFWILSADGRTFKVGCDCVHKTGDSGLIKNVNNAKNQIEAAKRQAKKEAKIAAQRAKREALLQAQRDRNGGLTDTELDAQRQAAAAADRRAAMEAKNGWLLGILRLNAGGGGFVDAMIEKLETQEVRDLTDRMISVLRDIYAKATGGRTGSKKYDAAYDQFNTNAGLEE